MFNQNRRAVLGFLALAAVFTIVLLDNRFAVAEPDLRATYWVEARQTENLWSPIFSDGRQATNHFRQPNSDWGAGHRGIDYSADEGEGLQTPLGGVITFSGQVFGRPVVVLRHENGLSSEFEPVCLNADLARGQRLDPRVQFASVCFLGDNSHCSSTCLHWGIKTPNQGYLSPERFLGSLSPSRLSPIGEV
jgi:murein DD-endopeptidase MepM/ murein hydrolase activator NlpD